MISGIKISQLPVVTDLYNTDYFIVRRGSTTNQISQLTLINSISAQNVGSGSDIIAESLTQNGVISIKRLSAVGNFLTLDTTTDTLILSGIIPVDGITDTMILEITGIGKVLPQAINTDNSLSGQVLYSQGAGEVAIWGDVPFEASVESTPNKVVLRDLSGNFYAGTIFAYLSGTAETSTKWLSARTLTLSGNVLGNINIDGSQDVTVFTEISAGTITDSHISDIAGIADYKLNTITTPQKVAPGAIDYFGTQPGDVLTSTGSATVWQNLSSLTPNIVDNSITTSKLAIEAVTEQILADNSVTTPKISAGSVTTDKIADNAITTSTILDGSVTLQKTTATPAALPSTLVSRDATGNLSAVEIIGNLRGNATTANAWSSPMTLTLEGDLNGQVSFSGNQPTSLITFLRPALPVWALYDATQLDILSGIYIQGSTTLSSEEITVYQTVSTTDFANATGIFYQDSGLIDVNVLDIDLPTNNPEVFLTTNLLTGTILTATFFDQGFVPLTSGVYTIIDRSYGALFTNTYTIILSTTDNQTADGFIAIDFQRINMNRPHNFSTNHIVNVNFLSGSSLATDPFVEQVSGLYVVLTSVDPYSFVLGNGPEFSTFQAASGIIHVLRCKNDSNFGISNVTYIDTGNHILNFDTQFDHPFYYGFTGSGVTLSSTPTINSVDRLIDDVQNEKNLQIRTLKLDGTLEPYNFKRTTVACFGNRQSS
jgi:hypothetical protein